LGDTGAKVIKNSRNQVCGDTGAKVIKGIRAGLGLLVIQGGAKGDQGRIRVCRIQELKVIKESKGIKFIRNTGLR
jgi:hypothetical protein